MPFLPSGRSRHLMAIRCGRCECPRTRCTLSAPLRSAPYGGGRVTCRTCRHSVASKTRPECPDFVRCKRRTCHSPSRGTVLSHRLESHSDHAKREMPPAERLRTWTRVGMVARTPGVPTGTCASPLQWFEALPGVPSPFEPALVHRHSTPFPERGFICVRPTLHRRSPAGPARGDLGRATRAQALGHSESVFH
jgi:hypothetical protein